MKGCGVPSKGNVGAGEHAHSQCLIVSLSLSRRRSCFTAPNTENGTGEGPRVYFKFTSPLLYAAWDHFL